MFSPSRLSSDSSCLTITFQFHPAPDTVDTRMFYAHDTRYGETTNSSDHEPGLQRRKVPRLTLSTDVKTFYSCRHYTTAPSMPNSLVHMSRSPYDGLPQMEVDEVILYSNHLPRSNQTIRTSRSLEENLDSRHGDKRRSLDPAYTALFPTSLLGSSTAARAAEIPSFQQHRHVSPSYLQHARDTSSDKTRHSRLQPSSFYPSPPQSTAASPLEVTNPVPSPIQPSPSLPLHQPRPSRRIPIVSLSQLASACEETEKTFTRRPVTHTKHRLDSLSGVSRNVYHTNHRTSPYSKIDRDKQMAWQASSREDYKTDLFVRCSCGCMGSYAVS
jgi:hypothetical protein